jgi:outer membrane protein assembly factor BamD
MIILYKFLVILLLVTSCQSKKDLDVEVPAIEAYTKGLGLLKKDNYKDASEEFSKVYFQHPGNEITPYAELMEAYSLYKARKYEDAVDVIENFLAIHPLHEDVAYAMYLKSICYYMQISDVHHDQGITSKTKSSMTDLIQRFPTSKYALDMSLKIDLANDHLAGKEMEIGRYYQKRMNPIGAINRFQTVVRDYQTTTHTPEALYRLTESFLLLGLGEEAQKYAAVLAYNYQDSSWYKHSLALLQKHK